MPPRTKPGKGAAAAAEPSKPRGRPRKTAKSAQETQAPPSLTLEQTPEADLTDNNSDTAPSTPVRATGPPLIFPPPPRANAYETFNLADVLGSSDEEDAGGNSPSTPTPAPQGNINSQPAIYISPIKQKRRDIAPKIAKQTDLEVWNLEDAVIIEASWLTWKLDVYKHFNITLQRDYNEDGTPDCMIYIFTCKVDSDHNFQRDRMSGASVGTTNIWIGVTSCQARFGTKPEDDAVRPTKGSSEVILYSEAAHRALIAIRCAWHKRPFNSVEDPKYQAEVNMLRPGTILPSAQTVSRDGNLLYKELSFDVRAYFQSLASTIHLVLDGWTAPILASYLGIVIVWYTNGKLHRQILEFIRLTEAHDGQYLAKVLAECIKRFQLEDLLFALCMDNASNCDRLALVLPQYLRKFRGMNARARCFAHIINLIAKIFISFFFKRPKSKKSAKANAAAGIDGTGGQRQTVVTEDIGEDGEENDMNDPDTAIALEEAVEDEKEKEDEDEGRTEHDKIVVKSMRDQAIRNMAEMGVFMSRAEEQEALKLFPRVSGLARRVHDSPTLAEEFKRIVDKTPGLKGKRNTLSYLHFKDVIKPFVATPHYKLGAYALSDRLLILAQMLCDILEQFDDITNLFSQAEVPLVVEVLPMLRTLEENLKMVCNDEESQLDDWPVVRIASEAALLLIKKYLVLTGECELYHISIIMCPDRKLSWFRDNGFSKEECDALQVKAITCFKERYTPNAPAPQPANVGSEPTQKPLFDFKKNAAPAEKTPLDSIERYLADPLLTAEYIKKSGGYIQYWTRELATCPQLARMALDFCSVPASSVDAERAFSGGRLQVNHLQHNMNSQTFKAQVALGSWVTAESYAGFNRARQIIQTSMTGSANPTP